MAADEARAFMLVHDRLHPRGCEASSFGDRGDAHPREVEAISQYREDREFVVALRRPNRALF
jgi:hypothetical protein